MQSGSWALALPTYFLIGPEGLLGNTVLFVSLGFVIAMKDRGWPVYTLSVVCPAIFQIIMLASLGIIDRSENKSIQYAIILVTVFVSLYAMYWSFRISRRKVVRVFILCSQIYEMALAFFLALMSANNNWL